MNGVITIANDMFNLHPPFPPETDITAYRDFVRREYGPMMNMAEVGKSNARASPVRQEGNQLFKARKYDEALAKYNESICHAETGSEDLAILYANRSALFYEQGNYELALFNIALAKKNHYPERLMSKLLKREQSCKEKINPNLKTPPITQLQIVKDANPRIPFLANGIVMKVFPEFGRGLVADKDFGVGEVILNERPLVTSADRLMCYDYCAHCAKEYRQVFIPCPNCTVCVYCSEECLEEDKKYIHRFECGVSAKLFNLSERIMFIGSKFFFYGLSLFNDNVQEMMAFCQSARDTPERRLTLDYTNYDRMDEFKALHALKDNNRPERESYCRLVAAMLYYVYMKNPLVRSLFTTKAEKNFLLRSLQKYSKTVGQAAYVANQERLTLLSPIANLVNHSCDPNAALVAGSERVNIVVLRPVRKGEQICCGYGTTWWEENLTRPLTFTCLCVVCKLKKENKWKSSIRINVPAGMEHDIALLMTIYHSESANAKAKLNYMKQFIERYAFCHPHSLLATMLILYTRMMHTVCVEELRSLEFAKIAASVL